ncbi:hypothetical protein HDU99_005779 [Rhizoclosmatium hyalinum]|nr:hypothetical protein HDU99_005779 [Rhizoclosmatium hyalinum]
MPTTYGSGYVGVVDLNTPHASGITPIFKEPMAIHMDPVGGHAVYNGTIAPTKGVFVVLDWNKPDGVQSDEVDWKPYLNLPKETANLAAVVESWGIDKHLVDCVRAAKRLSPVSLKDLPDLPVLYKGRVVLIGDSAHGTLPTYGQGLNLALEDAATLGDLFGHFQENEDVEKVFALYDQIRKPKVHELSAHSRSVAARMRAPNHIAKRIGRFFMRLVFTIQNIFALNDAILYHNYRTDIEEAVPGIKFN